MLMRSWAANECGLERLSIIMRNYPLDKTSLLERKKSENEQFDVERIKQNLRKRFHWQFSFLIKRARLLRPRRVKVVFHRRCVPLDETGLERKHSSKKMLFTLFKWRYCLFSLASRCRSTHKFQSDFRCSTLELQHTIDVLLRRWNRLIICYCVFLDQFHFWQLAYDF